MRGASGRAVQCVVRCGQVKGGQGRTKAMNAQEILRSGAGSPVNLLVLPWRGEIYRWPLHLFVVTDWALTLALALALGKYTGGGRHLFVVALICARQHFS